MVQDRWWPNSRPYVPREVRHPEGTAYRPSVESLIGMIDTSDPAFPATAAFLADMASAGVELDEAAVTIAMKLGKQQLERDRTAIATAPEIRRAPVHPEADPTGWPSIVYYIKRGEVIKIGTTTNAKRRFQNLVPDEILAWEPGGAAEETARHRQFTHLRCGEGEYFRPGLDLIKHCAAIRSANGAPDPSWRTTASIAMHSRTSPLPSELPVPTSTDLATAVEAASALGIKKATILTWVHRKRLRPVTTDAKGRDLFHLDHLRHLKSQSRPYRDAV